MGGMLLEPTNVLREGERVCFFVDGANMDHTMGRTGVFLDWSKTLSYFLAGGTFCGAYYFGTEYLDDEAQRCLHDDLARAGFVVRSKRVKLIRDRATGEERLKGNVDIELALEMVAAADKFDACYLFSGDSDFQRVLEILQSRGKRVFVVSSHESLSQELFHAAEKPVWFVEDFADILRREENGGASS